MSTSGVACVNSNATAGELVDLAAKGAQDVLLTCDPKCSLFHQSYCRITNFAMGEQTITFQNAPSGRDWTAASNIRAEVLRAGDLLGPVYLDGCLSGLPIPTEVSGAPTELKVKMWTPAVGFALVQQTRANIGAQNFETIESEYLMMHDEISRSAGLRASALVGDYGAHLRGCALQGTAGLEALSVHGSDEAAFAKGIQYSTRSQKILTPLSHFWTSHAGNYLNVVGAQYHNIVLELDIRSSAAVKICGTLQRQTGEFVPDGAGNGYAIEPVEDSGQGVLSGLSILAVYIQLDTAERRLKAQAAQTMRMVYVQGAQYPTVATDAGTTKQISNFFNHPTTRYVWAWRSTAATAVQSKPEWFEFGAYRGARYSLTQGAALSDIYSPVQEVVPEIQQFELQINNHSRVHQASEYFLYAQPYQHAKRVPDRIVYSYAFAMYPEAADMHSGSMNQSRIDNIVLRFTFKPQVDTGAIIPLAGNANTVLQNSVAGLNGVQTGTSESGVSPALTAQEVAAGSSAGTIFFYSEAINFYKQAAGMFGLLFAN